MNGQARVVAKLPNIALRDAPIEFAEVASMGMELLAGRYLEEFYSPGDANRARSEHLEETVKFDTADHVVAQARLVYHDRWGGLLPRIAAS